MARPASRHRLIALAAAMCALALAVASPTAYAGPLLESAPSCTDRVFEHPFVPWADPAAYVLAPNGTFEKSTGWKLAGASRVSGNEPYYVHAAGDKHSLSLPPGSSARSATMCVGIEHPTLRLFARNTGSALSTLRVNVLYEDAQGEVRSATIGELSGTSTWHPTPAMALVVNALALLPGDHTPVALRFEPQGPDGGWQIDDVYVDPYMK